MSSRRKYPPDWPYKGGVQDNERNRAILRRRKEGLTLSQISKEFNLSVERVRQISGLLEALHASYPSPK